MQVAGDVTVKRADFRAPPNAEHFETLRRAIEMASPHGTEFSIMPGGKIPPSGFDKLSPDQLTALEAVLEPLYLGTRMGRDGIIHREGLTFEIVSAAEAEAYRRYRAQPLPDLQIPASFEAARTSASVRSALDRSVVLAGRASDPLARTLADLLGIEMVATSHMKFSGSETQSVIGDSIRGRRPIIAQSFVGDVDRCLASTEYLLNAASRASDEPIILYMPFLPYQRQDRRGALRTAVSPQMLFSRLEAAGRGRLSSIVTIDMHTLQAEGMSGKINVHNLSGSALFLPRLKALVGDQKLAVVFPDAGARKRAREDGLDRKLERMFPDQVVFGTMAKSRSDGQGQGVDKSVFEGDPAAVRGRVVAVFDDMMDTGNTGIEGIKTLWGLGPSAMYFFATHPVLARLVVERMRAERAPHDPSRPLVDGLVVSNTIPLRRDPGELITVTDVDVMGAHFLAGVVSSGGFSTRELADLYSGVNGFHPK